MSLGVVDAAGDGALLDPEPFLAMAWSSEVGAVRWSVDAGWLYAVHVHRW